jgi:hypothetical protein
MRSLVFLPFLRCAVVAALVLPLEYGMAEGDPLSISRWTIDVGGAGFSRVGTWTLAGTVGQHDAGRVQNGTYSVSGGFWGPGPMVVSTVEIPVPDPSDPASEPAPSVARILPAAPNPTSDASAFRFELPAATRVRVQVFNVSGALVRTVTDRTWMAGRHQVSWDGRGEGGTPAAAGLYFARVRLGTLERTQKLLIVR